MVDNNFGTPDTRVSTNCKLSSLLSLLLLHNCSSPTLTAISPFRLRKPQPVAFFRSRGYYCLMKLLNRFVIFLLCPSFFSPSALHKRYALCGVDYHVSGIFSKYFNTAEIVGIYSNGAIQSRTKTWFLSVSTIEKKWVAWSYLQYNFLQLNVWLKRLIEI